jgi:hypothetical protein
MFDPTTLTGIHTIVSLISLALGLGVIVELTGGRAGRIVTTLFLATALFTSVTGFLFPIHGPTPALIVGVVALIVLALVFAAQARGWRRTYAASLVLSVYFLAFVTIAQSFAKIPALKALAPTQTEPPFAAAQGVLLIAFIAVGFLATRAYGRGPAASAIAA